MRRTDFAEGLVSVRVSGRVFNNYGLATNIVVPAYSMGNTLYKT